MRHRNTAGFTILELLFAVLVGSLLVLTVARAMDGADRVGDATRAGADARALEETLERVLRRSLEEAGSGMPSSPNLGGVGVRVADRPDGRPADTLVVLRGEGDALPVAARACRPGIGPCVALLGDHRGRLAPGDLLLVGTRALGLSALQVTAAPALVHAPCGADCPEPVACPLGRGPAHRLARVVGSIREPGGETSALPCPGAYLADGRRCAEIVATVEVAPPRQDACRVEGRAAAFTEVPVADRTAALGFPAPPGALLRGGAAGTPHVRAVRVRASRLWVRGSDGEDPVLVRENGLDAQGRWRRGVAVAGPVLGLRVETLHRGAWHPGAGVAAAELVPTPTNPNYRWLAAPEASGTAPGAEFRRGHHTIAAVRIRYLFPVASAGHGLRASREAWTLVPTPGLLEGGAGAAR